MVWMGLHRTEVQFLFGGVLLGLLLGCAGPQTTVQKKPPKFAAISSIPANIAVDYIAIGPHVLLTAIEPLLAHRAKKGLKVKRLALEDVVPASEATEDATGPILATMRLIASESGPRLRFVLLVGDATGYNEMDSERRSVPTFYRRKIQYWDDDPFERERTDLRDAREKRRIRFSETEYSTNWPYALAHIDAPGQPAFAAKAQPKPLAVGRVPARMPEASDYPSANRQSSPCRR